MKLLSDNLYITGQIKPSDFAEFAAAGIRQIINNRPDGEEVGQLSHHDAQQLAQQHDISYYYLPMENGKPLPENLVGDFRALLDTSQPTLAHCRSGMRSTLIWALGQIETGALSVDETLHAAAGAAIPLQNAKAVLEAAANQAQQKN